MDLSLDDIIQKRNIKVPFKGRGGNNRAKQQGRKNVPNKTANTNQNRTFIKNRNAGIKTGRVGKINQTRQVNQAIPIVDARQKIIQKNRQKLTDAREKLGEIAKQTDARLKLEKLRVGRQAGRHPLPVTNPRIQGRRNPDQLQRRNQVPLQRTIRQSIGPLSIDGQTRSHIPVLPTGYRYTLDDMDVDMEVAAPLTGVSQVLRRTISNEQATSRHILRPSAMQSFSSWPTSRVQKEPEPVSRGYVDVGYAEERVRTKPSPNVSLTNRWGGRTANNPVQNSSAKPRSQGYRIIISNLHDAVIDEDIQELFEDLGPLLESRLVRPGTAEVVFKQLKDAERAVELYHNRHLDGQPMKCMLVNGRPTGGSSPPHPSALRSSLAIMPAARTGSKIASGSKSTVVPDISTIHKALFNRS